MKLNTHSPNVETVLRAEIEEWQRDSRGSRQAVAIAVMEAHAARDQERMTGIDFSFLGDAYDASKKAAQKLFRWLDSNGALPANMLPTILKVMPLDRALHCLNQILLPLGIEARAIEQAPSKQFDSRKHLLTVMKEGGDGNMALINLGSEASVFDLQFALKEITEAERAYGDAASEIRAELTTRQAMARISSQST